MKVWNTPLTAGLCAGLLLVATGCNNTPSAPEPAPTGTEPSTQATPPVSSDITADNPKMGGLFPGAELKGKPWKLAGDAPYHLNKDISMKFKGDEAMWEVFEASKDGQRLGLVILTHAILPDQKGLHVAVGFDAKFKINGVVPVENTDAAIGKLATQFKGKSYEQPFKIGKDLKAVEGLTNDNAQELADTVRRAGWIINEYFNAAAAAAHAKEHADEHGHGHKSDGSH